MRAGLRRLLADFREIDVVGEAGDGKETLRMVRQLKPDVVVMDLSMPGMDGMETTRTMVDEGLKCRVLILTMHATEYYASRLLRAGASGFVGKGVEIAELVRGICKVAGGGRYLPQSLMDAIPLSCAIKSDDASPMETLSDRELQVLKFLAEGLNGREIAEKLHLSIKTVDTYRARLLEKLGLDSTADLIRFALRHRVIESTW